MKKVWKKTATIMMAAGLGIAAGFPMQTTYAATDNIIQEDSSNMKQAKYKQPEEWNKTELKAYQFDSTDKFELYMSTGGSHFYNKNFKSEDHMVKITAADSGYFAIAVTTNGKSSQKVTLYDASKKKVLAKTTSDDDLEYGKLVKAGDVFYVKMPDKIDKIVIREGVVKDGFTSMKASDTYYESGTGASTYHPFSISKRSAVEFNISSIERKGGETYAHVERKENGLWKRLDNTVKIKPASYDDDFVHGLSKGEYRLVIKAPKTQLNAVSYTRSPISKKVSYKKSKAKNIRLDDEITNMYTTKEKAVRWYKLKVTSTKQQRILTLGEDTVSGGYSFTIYRSGSKKAYKTIKVTQTATAKTAKLPKKTGTYYLKVSKITSKTNGTYEIGYY